MIIIEVCAYRRQMVSHHKGMNMEIYQSRCEHNTVGLCLSVQSIHMYNYVCMTEVKEIWSAD